MVDLNSSVTTTIEVGPPKYQVVIPSQVRRALDFEGDRVIIETEITVKRVIDDGGEST